MQDREFTSRPDEGQREVRVTQRRYVEIWVEALRRIDPALPESDARTMAHATFGLINSTPHSADPRSPEHPRGAATHGTGSSRRDPLGSRGRAVTNGDRMSYFERLGPTSFRAPNMSVGRGTRRSSTSLPLSG